MGVIFEVKTIYIFAFGALIAINAWCDPSEDGRMIGSGSSSDRRVSFEITTGKKYANVLLLKTDKQNVTIQLEDGKDKTIPLTFITKSTRDGLPSEYERNRVVESAPKPRLTICAKVSKISTNGFYSHHWQYVSGIELQFNDIFVEGVNVSNLADGEDWFGDVRENGIITNDAKRVRCYTAMTK